MARERPLGILISSLHVRAVVVRDRYRVSRGGSEWKHRRSFVPGVARNGARLPMCRPGRGLSAILADRYSLKEKIGCGKIGCGKKKKRERKKRVPSIYISARRFRAAPRRLERLD